MAHKSKTQRAKATARKQARREQEEREAQIAQQAEAVEESGAEVEVVAKKAEKKKATKQESSAAAVSKIEKKVENKPEKKKKKRGKIAQFFVDVKSEMKRVTWPTRQDVLRWSGVVVFALLFFGIFTAVLDNIIITPALVALSGLGA